MFQRLCSELQPPLEPSDIRAHALPHTGDFAGAPSAPHTQPTPCSEAGHAHGFTHTLHRLTVFWVSHWDLRGHTTHSMTPTEPLPSEDTLPGQVIVRRVLEGLVAILRGSHAAQVGGGAVSFESTVRVMHGEGDR